MERSLELYRIAAFQQAYRCMRGTAAAFPRDETLAVRDLYLLSEAVATERALASAAPRHQRSHGACARSSARGTTASRSACPSRCARSNRSTARCSPARPRSRIAREPEPFACMGANVRRNAAGADRTLPRPRLGPAARRDRQCRARSGLHCRNRSTSRRAPPDPRASSGSTAGPARGPPTMTRTTSSPACG